MKIEKFIMLKLSTGAPPIIRVWRIEFVVVISGDYWGSEFCMENLGALFLLLPRSQGSTPRMGDRVTYIFGIETIGWRSLV